VGKAWQLGCVIVLAFVIVITGVMLAASCVAHLL
jgi:hypothetical protein